MNTDFGRRLAQICRLQVAHALDTQNVVGGVPGSADDRPGIAADPLVIVVLDCPYTAIALELDGPGGYAASTDKIPGGESLEEDSVHRLCKREALSAESWCQYFLRHPHAFIGRQTMVKKVFMTAHEMVWQRFRAQTHG